jgi:septal ring factor EnvC (AmiA/AmiB activator)
MTVGLFLAGLSCGPRKASKETLSQIEELKSAIESAKAKKSELATKIESLKKDLERKDTVINQLESEIDSLRRWLNLLEQGY